MDLIERQAAIDAADKIIERDTSGSNAVVNAMIAWSEYIRTLPSAQPEYEPVTAEDFARAMSETTVYSYMAWYGTALAFMERQGFVICKKTM